MNINIKRTLLPLIILLTSAIIGSTLLIIVYCLPTDKMAQNVASGAETLLVEGPAFEYASDYKAAILDNSTDAIMLTETICPSVQNPVTDAMLVPRYVYQGSSSPELSLMAFLNNNTEAERFVITYPRYWHGYLIFLKPFFLFFNYADSRMFHLGFQLILFAVLIWLFNRRNLQQFVLPLILLFVLWNPASTGLCMQYYACFYISIFSMIIMLWKKEFLLKDDFYFDIFFLLVGICTSYFDYLTYPIATLGLPLCLWLLLVQSKNKRFFQLITNCLFWSIGYLGMWAEKWILSSWILGDNVIQDALSTIVSRTSTSVEAENISRIETVFYLARTFFKWPYVVFFGIPFLYIIFSGLKRKPDLKYSYAKDKYIIFLLFILIALLPCAWFFIAANHSYIHPRLVYRNWGVTLYAIFAGIICFFQSKKTD